MENEDFSNQTNQLHIAAGLPHNAMQSWHMAHYNIPRLSVQPNNPPRHFCFSDVPFALFANKATNNSFGGAFQF